MLDRQIGISEHGMNAYAIFYPMADGKDLIRELDAGEAIERATGMALVGRTERDQNGDTRFLLHRERTGLFVISNGVLVTFLRFYSVEQYRTALRLWPTADPPTCAASWNRQDPDVMARSAEAEALNAARAKERRAKKKAKRAQDPAYVAMREAHALAKAKAAERRERGIQQAAALLRRNGWTCVEPAQ